ncbi:carboxyphosphonoenolpyruvate phosphonomutase, partial [Diplodia corticola]
MSPSILASCPSDDERLREKFSRKHPEDSSPVPTKRIKTHHRNAEPAGAPSAAPSRVPGHHSAPLPAKDLPADAERTTGSDDDDDHDQLEGRLMKTGPLVVSPPRSTPDLVSDDDSDIDTGCLPASTRLRRMIFDGSDRIVVCPGVFDGFSARVAMSVGFEGLYMTGAGTTASRLGQPDLAIAQLHDMKEQADMICNLDPINGPPVIADMD